MISKPLRIALMFLLVLAGGAGLALVHLDNVRLTRQIAAQRLVNQQATRLRGANQGLRELIDQAQATGAAAAQTMRADQARAQAEVALLEERANATHAQVASKQRADADALARNHDPNKGLARLEYFQNAGRATPADALQTFVWAALKGELDTTAGMVRIDDSAREDAATLIASLPEADRATFSTAERLAALFFTDAFTNMSAVEITGVTSTDATHATVEVRGLREKMQKVSLQLGPDGWQIVVPPGVVRNLAAWAGVGQPPRK